MILFKMQNFQKKKLCESIKIAKIKLYEKGIK